MGDWWFPVAGTDTFFVWGELLCLGDIASSESFLHQRLELQTIWQTHTLPEQTAEENLKAWTGATAGAVLCPHLQSCVPLGGPGCPHCPDSVSMPPQLTHHGRGKAGGSSWPHREHSTDLRHLQQSAPSLLCSYTADAITTHRHQCLPLTPCPAWLQCPSSKAQL